MIDIIGSRIWTRNGKPSALLCENFKVLQECLRHAAKSILNVSFGKITHNLTVYLQCMDCKNTTLEKQNVCCTQKYTSHYEHCNVSRAWTCGLLFKKITVPYSPQMHIATVLLTAIGSHASKCTAK